MRRQELASDNLHHYLSLNQNLPTHQLLDFAMQTCSGLAYLQLQELVHLNVCCSNLLVCIESGSGTNIIKIAGFGECQVL